MARVLSSDQIDAFRRDGFLLLRGLFTSADVRDQERWIDEIATRPPETGRQMVYYEDSLKEPGARVLARIEKFSEYHAGLGGLVADARLVGPIADLLGEDPVLFKEKVNFKMPGGAGFTPHQDIQPGWDRYAPYFISVLMAVDANTIENGCLELAAGHHQRGLIGRLWEPLEGDELAGVEFVPYPMAPGDVAFFDCFTPHQSQPNLTERPRRNIYLTYNRRSAGDFRERYFADKRKSYPPDFERDPTASYVFRV
jgi:ectoine hydroxylase-related dioxygenase (phytanoyl-CoA dioxygenase family)